MLVAIHQPSYFPWLGLLHKIANCDTYIVMDEVQLTDSAYQHRNLMLTTDGRPKYLTIPFNKKGYLGRPFNELEISDPSWRIKHLDFIRNNYRKHPYSRELMPTLEQYYGADYSRLVDAVMASMRIAFAWFGINTNVVMQSGLEYDRNLHKGDLVLALCQAVGATAYLSGSGAKSYLDQEDFRSHLPLHYDRFTHPEYPQRCAATFQPGMACLDAMFNLGPQVCDLLAG